MKIETLFPQDYSAELPHDLPGGTHPVSNFGEKGKTGGGRDGLLVKVRPSSSSETESWYGIFEFGFENSFREATGIYACPNPSQLLVASNGTAYLVDVDSPEKFTTARVYPLVEVKAVPALELILLVGLHSIEAIGQRGSLWLSESIAHDGLAIDYIDQSFIYGHETCDCSMNQPRNYFRVECKNGSFTRGFPHEKSGD